MTDLGNAERFAQRCKGRLLWCPSIGWLWWDGGWMLDERESFLAQQVNLHRIFALTARN